MTTPPAGPQEALLRMFDEAEAWPDIRAAIYRELVPEEAAVRGGAPAALREALRQALNVIALTYTTVPEGGRPHWCRNPAPPHEATCRGMLAVQDMGRLALSENTVDSLDELAKDVIAAARELPVTALALIERRGIVIDKWPPADIPADGWTPENFAALDPEVRWQGLFFTLWTDVISALAHPVREYDEAVAVSRRQPHPTPQRRRRMAKRPADAGAASPPTERVDLNDDGTVDDVAIEIGGGMFRLEQMDTGSYWLRIYMPDGSPTDHVFWLNSTRRIHVSHRTEEHYSRVAQPLTAPQRGATPPVDEEAG